MSTPLPPRKPKRSDKIREWFLNFLTKVLPTKADDRDTLLFKKVAYSLLGMFFLVAFLAASVFFLTLKGEEETMVPKVVGEDLIEAIQDLQDKELVPQIQVKFSDSPQEKGRVVSQDPQGGILVKAGRRITLWVSKGAIVDKIENYVGMNVNNVKLQLKSIFSTQAQPLLKIRDTPVYVFNNAAEGTILEQKPLPGTPLSAPTELDLVVSRGPRGQTVKIGAFVGQSYSDALLTLSRSNIPFRFKARKAEGSEAPGKIVSQNPTAGTEAPKGTILDLVMTIPPKSSDGQVFGVFETNLPDYPILVDLKLELKKANGDMVTLLQMKHPGGGFGVPYFASVGDEIILSLVDKEILRQKVTQ